jgi:hypothetical protein
MKYLIRTLLACVMMVSLCACGGGQGNAAQGKTADINVQSVLDEMLAQVEIEDPLVLTGTDMLDFFGIKEEDMAEFAAVTCANGISAQEIVLVKAVDEKSAELVEEKLENRLENRMAEFQNYLPEQYDILTECDVEREGVYVSMILHPQHEGLEELYDSYFDKD